MRAEQVRGGVLPDFGGVDLLSLSREPGHPVLAAVVTGLLPRAQGDRPAMAFYEDGPYQL